MKIGVLTSSRADFGIYLPLLQRLKSDNFFDLNLIVFGTHLSYFYGHTIDQIEKEGFRAAYCIESLLLTDSAGSVSTSMGLTMLKFSDFWRDNKQNFDLVLCLGDRYEMFAAVTAGLPFQIKFAHIHGGETTLGAIDNVFRHSLSLASQIHFVATNSYKEKVQALTNSTAVYNVGALALDGINNRAIPTIAQFKNRWGIDLAEKTILVTFHPETVNYQQNEEFADTLVSTIFAIKDFNFLITMPNADTGGNIFRKAFEAAFSQSPNVFMVENLGSANYFAAMRYCEFLMGNTSSGIIEAASFGKYVINLGDRQKGRASGKNVFNVAIEREAIINAVDQIKSLPKLTHDNVYYNGGAAAKIINVIKAL